MPMWKRCSALLILVIGFILIAGVSLWLDPSFYYQTFLEKRIDAALHRKLVIQGPIVLKWGNPVQVDLHDVYLVRSEGHGDLFTARTLSVGIGVWPLLQGQVEIRQLALDGARLNVIRRSSGKLNVQDLFSGHSTASPIHFRPDRFSVLGSELNVHDDLRQKTESVQIDRFVVKQPATDKGYLVAAGRFRIGGQSCSFHMRSGLRMRYHSGQLAFKAVQARIHSSWGHFDLMLPSAEVFLVRKRAVLDGFDLKGRTSKNQRMTVMGGKMVLSAHKIRYTPVQIGIHSGSQTIQLMLGAYSGAYPGPFPVHFVFQARHASLRQIKGHATIHLSRMNKADGKISFSFGAGLPSSGFHGHLNGSFGLNSDAKSVSMALSGQIAGSPAELKSRVDWHQPLHVFVEGRLHVLDFSKWPHGSGKVTPTGCYWLSGQLQVDRLILNQVIIRHALVAFDPGQCLFLP
ncbi:MAG: AsmA family protein [Proteobacteria bacterium]|nr:AsmA family protein [Pseudomonadota bacterium]